MWLETVISLVGHNYSTWRQTKVTPIHQTLSQIFIGRGWPARLASCMSYNLPLRLEWYYTGHNQYSYTLYMYLSTYFKCWRLVIPLKASQIATPPSSPMSVSWRLWIKIIDDIKKMYIHCVSMCMHVSCMLSITVLVKQADTKEATR